MDMERQAIAATQRSRNRSSGWTPASLGALGLGVACLTTAAILIAFHFAGRFETLIYSTPETGTAFNLGGILDGETAPPMKTGDARIVKLVIPEIGVDAPVVERGISADGVMEVPDNGRDVVWYDFTATPGAGGNAVFSGHVDFYDIGPAVFWELGELQSGDVVEIYLEDGEIYRYGVTSRAVFDAVTAPVEQIIGHTSNESVTLITCTGTFNRLTRQYDQRLVVRAERILVASQGTTAGNS